MKKVFAVMIAVALVLSLSVTAFAAGPDQNGSAGVSQQQNGGLQPGQMPSGGPQMNGQVPDGNGQPPQMNGQRPGMDNRGADMGPQTPSFVDFDAMVTQGVISQDTCDRIKAWMEEHKPADLPELPDMNSQRPGMDGRGPGMGPQAPGFMDFDAMVTQGVISQDTCDRIKAYMEEHKPADLPELDGQAPDGNGQPPEIDGEAHGGIGQPPEKPDMGGPSGSGEAPADLPEPPEMDGDAPMMGGLLAELLENEIISQSEYDALIEAQAK